MTDTKRPGGHVRPHEVDTSDGPPTFAPVSGWRRRAIDRSDLVRRAARKTVQQGEQLLEAARVLYYETSGEPFTIQQLADKAGISLQTFYRYFSSKDELLLALLEEVLREAAQRARGECEQVPDPIERLRVCIRWPFTQLGTPEATPYAQLIAREHLRLATQNAAGVRAASAPYRILLGEVIAAAAATGRPAQPPERLATFIGDLVTSQFHNLVLGVDPADPLELAGSLARFCLERLYDGD